MKKTCLLILTFILMRFAVSSAFAQNDRQNYTLSINQKDIGRLHDTIILKKRYLVSYIKIKFSNNSTNTLNYITYSCGWNWLFHSNNKTIKICYSICEYNTTIVKSIASRKTEEVILPVIVKMKPADIEFKIGMNLFLNNDENLKLFPLPVDKLDNVIWSNKVKLP